MKERKKERQTNRKKKQQERHKKRNKQNRKEIKQPNNQSASPSIRQWFHQRSTNKTSTSQWNKHTIHIWKRTARSHSSLFARGRDATGFPTQAPRPPHPTKVAPDGRNPSKSNGRDALPVLGTSHVEHHHHLPTSSSGSSSASANQFILAGVMGDAGHPSQWIVISENLISSTFHRNCGDCRWMLRQLMSLGIDVFHQ